MLAKNKFDNTPIAVGRLWRACPIRSGGFLLECCMAIWHSVNTSDVARGVKVGTRSGRLVVIGKWFQLPTVKPAMTREWWGVCKCDCGSVVIKRVSQFRDRKSKSCGCIGHEKIAQRNYRHGQTGTTLYKIWGAMIRRCTNEHDSHYHNYGGRGVTVCDDWHDARAFLQWATAHGYRDGLQIDRKDNDGNYTPDNCRFVDAKTNARNRRTNVLVPAFGETKTIIEWFEDDRCTCSYATLYARLTIFKWHPEKAIAHYVRGNGNARSNSTTVSRLADAAARDGDS